MVDAILQDLRYALRALRSSPGFAAVAILSLALGIGANTAIFSLIDAVMLRSLPVSKPEQLLQVVIDDKQTYFTNPIWEQIRDRQDVFSGVFAWGGVRFNLARGGEARYVDGSWVSGQFFETLGLHAILGRTITAAEDHRGCAATAVLSYGFWQKEYGGSGNILGQTISLDTHPFQIIGVAEPGFTGMDVGLAQEVFVPICSEATLRGENSFLDHRSAWWLSIVGRPKPGISENQVRARLRTLAPGVFQATLPPQWPSVETAAYVKHTFSTQSAAGGMSEVRTNYRLSLITLMVIVAAVLLIACANVANLLLARGAARQREIAIRMALGSGRARLIRQLLTESLLLSITGAALGIAFAQWGSRLLVRFLSTQRNQVTLDLSPDLRVLGFTMGIALLTGLLFGIAPALRGVRVQPQAAMKANSRGVIEGSKFGIGKTLVMVQVALSLVLLIGASLLLATFRNLATIDPGFDRDRVLLAFVDLRNANYPRPRREATFARMLDQLRAIPGVRSASESMLTPLGNMGWNDILEIDGYTAKSRNDTLVFFNQVSPKFFETLGTAILAGRDFNDHDTPDAPPVAIVNQTFARKFFGSDNPLGKHYRGRQGDKSGDPVEIVGVVRDAKYRTLREEIPPTAYVATDKRGPFQSLIFELRNASGAATDLIPAARQAFAEVDSAASLKFTTLAIQVDESMNRERLLATLSGFFGALALLLATVGLYGVMSYNVARRRNEIGIRMALGAEQTRVLRMVLGEVATLIGIGVAAGLGIALATTRFVASFLYGLKANDPWTISIAAAILGLVAAFAGYLPARRASRLDPMTALREE